VTDGQTDRHRMTAKRQTDRQQSITQNTKFIYRQITRKWYKIEIQWQTNSKSYLSNGDIFNDLKRPLPSSISRSRHYLMLNISETVRDTHCSLNGKLVGIYTRPTQG